LQVSDSASVMQDVTSPANPVVDTTGKSSVANIHGSASASTDGSVKRNLLRDFDNDGIPDTSNASGNGNKNTLSPK
jgi:hypothetical protein